MGAVQQRRMGIKLYLEEVGGRAARIKRRATEAQSGGQDEEGTCGGERRGVAIAQAKGPLGETEGWRETNCWRARIDEM